MATAPRARARDCECDMNIEDEMLKQISRLAFENGRMRFLIGEAITSMSHAEIFLESREKMHPTGVQLWGELIDRLREVIADREPEPLGNESARLEGGV